MIALWRSEILPGLNERFDEVTKLLQERAEKIQKEFKEEKGLEVLRAYYGLKMDIRIHLDLLEGDLYWDNKSTREETAELLILNVTLGVRCNLDENVGE